MTLLHRVYPKPQTIEVSVEEPARPEVVGRGLQDSTLYRVEVTIEKVRLHLLKKVFDAAKNPEARVREIFDRHAELKNRNLPTIPLMFRDLEDSRTLYVTDLTEGGRRECMSIMDWQSNGSRDGIRCGDYRLFNLRNAEQVSVDFANLLERSSAKGVACTSSDVYFLVFDRATGVAKVILGDLGQIELKPPAEWAASYALEQNLSSMGSFFWDMNKHLDPNPLRRESFILRYQSLIAGFA